VESRVTTTGFAELIERAGGTGFTFKAHPQMLRYPCGSPLPMSRMTYRERQARASHSHRACRPQGARKSWDLSPRASAHGERRSEAPSYS